MQRQVIHISVAAAGLSLVLGGGAAFLSLGHKSQSPASPGSSVAAELSHLRQQVSDIKADVSNRARPITVVSTVAAAEPSTAAEPAASDPNAAREQLYLETKAIFEREFLRAGAATHWSRDREAALRSTFGGAPAELGRQVTAIECRGDMCKVETEHASALEATAFMDEMEQRPGFQGSRFVRIRKHQGTETYAFFVQPRDTLPQ